jgi:hypothetical protein
LIKGFFPAFGRRLKGWKAGAVELRENGLLVDFSGRNRGGVRLRLQGVIGFRDSGLIDAALVEFRQEDKGSYKELTIVGLKGAVLFKCRFMEGELG